MICLVTDRVRLAGAAAFEEARRCLLAQCRSAVEAEIDLIQLREPDLDARRLAMLVADIVSVRRDSRTRVVVNERLDVALACGADGVHLRAGSMPADSVRQIAPPAFLIGRSVHSPEEAERCGAVDYLIAGTVYPTPSKAGRPALLGLAGLSALVRAARVPVLAIGGMAAESVADVARAGASGVAGIGMFMDSFDRPSLDGEVGRCRAMELRGIAGDLRRRFDTSRAAS